MPRIAFHLLAAASLLAGAWRAEAARRPRYGGTLRVELREPRALDPAAWPMVFEPLVTLDESGRARPALAVSWQREAAGKRWVFRLRAGVQFHDGAVMTAQGVAASLVERGWIAVVSGEDVVVTSTTATPLAAFAERRNAVWTRGADGTPQGTGPFRVVKWEAQRATLAANDDYWGGRPFLDGADVAMGHTAQQRLLDLELGKADLVELAPGDVRRATQAGARIWTSAPVTLVALVFVKGRPAAEDAALREALALSIDRAAIVNVLLQKQGEAAGGLLPQWVSGYAALFSKVRDAARARQLVTGAPSLAMAYDAGDALGRMVAERIALNAREVGIRLAAPAAPGTADLRLVRARAAPPMPDAALASVAAALGMAELLHPPGATLDSVYESERALVEDHRVIPLFHLPEIYGASTKLNAWATPGLARRGEWKFDDLWLEAETR